MEHTYFEAPEYPFLDKLKKSATLFLKYGTALLATLIFLRILEWVHVFVFAKAPINLFSDLVKSFYFDLIFFFKTLAPLYLLVTLFYFSFRRQRTIYIASGIVFSIYLLIHVLLLKYYFTSFLPLGADLYGYSLADIRETVVAGTSIDVFTIIIFLLPFVMLWFLMAKCEKIKFYRHSMVVTVGVISIGLLFFGVSAVPAENSFKNENDYNNALNKSAYFFEKSSAYFFDNEPEVDIYAANYFDGDGQGTAGFKPFTYVDNAYPFLRKDETEDVLSNFFNIDSTVKPNVVFIQVEGLGRAFSGPDAYLGSFTPFLEQLRGKSLYFENFLAAQGRTFASLPSIMGSLPFYEKGFNDLGASMPSPITSFSLAKKSGYQTSFLMGTDTQFDNEGIFIRKQGITNVISKASFGDFPASHNSYWGFPDQDLMEKSIAHFSQMQQPFMSYIQTVSMHTPYKVPGLENFRSQVEKHMSQQGFTEAQKVEHRQYIDQYACIMYADAALKYFFNTFAQLPAYKNTIFIITGDHRLPEIPMSTKIDRYHVPLLIYSAMLKRSASIKSVSSHLDIAPSLVKFLAVHKAIKAPSLATWVGSGLDTVAQLRNVHKYPLKQTVNNLHNFISGDYFLDENTLFSLADNMQIEKSEDNSKLLSLQGQFKEYLARNKQLTNRGKLLPDSLAKKYAY